MYCALAIVAQHRLTMQWHASTKFAHQELQCATYYDSAIKDLQLRLTDSTLSIDEGTITAMLLLICDVSTFEVLITRPSLLKLLKHKSLHAAANFRRHMDAIHVIITLRGGLQTLATNKKLRLLLFW